MFYGAMTYARAIETGSEEMLQCSGVRIPFDPTIITTSIEAAVRSGTFEAEEAAELPFIVETDDVVLEIGAGIGFISTLLSRQDKVRKVIAVEANPNLLDYMARLHQTNGVTNVDRRNVVLTNADVSELDFYLRRDFWMGSLSATPNPYYAVARVGAASLDRTLRDEKVSMIVCDIEGAETEIFDGADLSGVDRIYLEVHDHVTGLCGVRRLFDTMACQGFAFDPRHSSRSIVLFRRISENEILRPYSG